MITRRGVLIGGFSYPFFSGDACSFVFPMAWKAIELFSVAWGAYSGAEELRKRFLNPADQKKIDADVANSVQNNEFNVHFYNKIENNYKLNVFKNQEFGCAATERSKSDNIFYVTTAMNNVINIGNGFAVAASGAVSELRDSRFDEKNIVILTRPFAVFLKPTRKENISVSEYLFQMIYLSPGGSVGLQWSVDMSSYKNQRFSYAVQNNENKTVIKNTIRGLG